MKARERGPKLGLSYDDVLIVPQRTRATSRSLVDVSSHVTRKLNLHWPIVAANVPFCTEARMAIAMAKLGAIGFVHRMCTIDKQVEQVSATKRAAFPRDLAPYATTDSEGRLSVGAAVGVSNDAQQRADAVVAAGADVLVVDVAHGHADYVIEAVAGFKARYPDVEIVAGNVATTGGARDLIDAGADAIKVGIGPGGICTTRQVAGAGVPQLTAIMDCVDVARSRGIPVIADGGIRHSGDIAKALAAGASTVMLGSALAGTDESAAVLVEDAGTKYKVTTGFVTLGVKLTLRHLNQETISEDELRSYVPEGVESTYEYRGSVESVLLSLVGGLQSGMSYSGALSVGELWEKAEFCQVTAAGFAEGKPHALERASRHVHPNYRQLLVGRN